MNILNIILWIWCVFGLLNVVIIGSQVFGKTDDEISEELDVEENIIFEYIGGKVGIILVAFLMGPTVLAFSITNKDE